MWDWPHFSLHNYWVPTSSCLPEYSLMQQKRNHKYEIGNGIACKRAVYYFSYLLVYEECLLVMEKWLYHKSLF